MRHPMLLACLAATSLSLPGPVLAQDPRMNLPAGELPFPGELASAGFKDADYLTPILQMERRSEEYARSAMWAGTFAQLLSTHYSLAGENAAARARHDGREEPRPSTSGEGAALEGLRARDAARVVAEAARTHRAVFVNEAHHVARHRAFTASLLQGLYDRGFRYFAVEAVNERDTALNARGYPLFRKTGLYVNEPAFGELVRAALRIGYRVIPYDVAAAVPPRPGDPAWAANERERIQAQNLFDATLARDPDARILVHAGYDHIKERPLGPVTPMAAKFREISGIDPFTVDQVAMMERSSPVYESPLYRAAVEGGRIRRSTIFMRPDGRPYSASDAVDAQVFHPREREVRGRPEWLLAGGGRRAYAVKGVPAEAPVLLQAFLAVEGVQGVPVDQLVLRQPGAADPVLILAPGRHLVRVVGPGGRVLKQEEVEAAGEGTIALR